MPLRGEGGNARRPARWAFSSPNYTTGLVSPGGNAPDVTIPVLGITQADGATLKTAVAAGPVTASLRRDATKGYAGADTSARAFMYAPSTVLTGSSLVHWDTSAAPPLLMEPVISPSLGSELDLTVPLLRDVGWFPGRRVGHRHGAEHARLRGHREEASPSP